MEEKKRKQGGREEGRKEGTEEARNMKSGIVCDNNKLIATLGRKLEIELVLVLVMISILNLKMGNI